MFTNISILYFSVRRFSSLHWRLVRTLFSGVTDQRFVMDSCGFLASVTLLFRASWGKGFGLSKTIFCLRTTDHTLTLDMGGRCPAETFHASTSLLYGNAFGVSLSAVVGRVILLFFSFVRVVDAFITRLRLASLTILFSRRRTTDFFVYIKNRARAPDYSCKFVSVLVFAFMFDA